MKILKVLFLAMVVMLFAVSPVMAAVNAVTPSTNEINRTNGWAYVNQVSAGGTSFQFINPRTLWSCFEYRTDGNTSQVIAENGGVNYNTFVTDGLYPYQCQNNNTGTYTIPANGYVEVRMVFGGETDERFDWTSFTVTPSFSCVGFQSPVAENTIKVKKNRVIPFKAELLDGVMPIIGTEIAPPVIQIMFNSGSGDVLVTEEPLSAGQGTEGNQFEFSGGIWQFNLQTKGYASGRYTVTLESGNTNEYTIKPPTCTGTFVIE